MQRLVCIVEGEGDVQAVPRLLHQQQLIQRVNVGRLRRLSRSFDKLVRTLSLICKVETPARERDG